VAKVRQGSSPRGRRSGQESMVARLRRLRLVARIGGFDRPTSRCLRSGRAHRRRRPSQSGYGRRPEFRSGVQVDKWLNRVPALIEAWYPGQEGGNAIADILLGEANPSDGYRRRFRSDGRTRRPSVVTGTEWRRGLCEVSLSVTGTSKKKSRPGLSFGHVSRLPDSPTAISRSIPRRSLAARPLKSPSSSRTSYARRRRGRPALCPRRSLERRASVKELKAFEKVVLKKGEEKTMTFVLTKRHFVSTSCARDWTSSGCI